MAINAMMLIFLFFLVSQRTRIVVAKDERHGRYNWETERRIRIPSTRSWKQR